MIRNAFKYLQYEVNRNVTLKKYTFVFIMYAIIIFNRSIVINRYVSEGVHYYFWDVVFYVFCSSKIVTFLLPFIFIIINSDLMFDNSLESQIILRINSRKVWWNVKVIVMIINILLCIISLIIITFIISLRFPYQNQWGNSFDIVNQLNLSLNIELPHILNTDVFVYTPIQAFLILLVLITLGYTSIGLFIMITSLMLYKRITPILSGFFIMIITTIPDLQDGHTIIENIIYNNLLLNTHRFNSSNPIYNSISYSIVYWLFLIISFYYFGYYLSLKKNFYGNKR